MRLAIVTQRVIRGEGQGRVNYEIARQALRRGWQVTLVTSEVDEELRAQPEVTWAQIPYTTRWTTLAGIFLFARRSAEWLRRNRSGIDIVHVNGFNTLAPGDVNAAHFVHGAFRQSHSDNFGALSIQGAYRLLYSSVNARTEKWAYARARGVVAVSERVRQELIGIGVPPARIQVILNGVDLQEFQPGREDRATLGLPIEPPLAIFVGDIKTTRKNLDTVLKALVEAPDLHLAVVGRTEGSPFPAMAVQLGLESRVHFLGFRRDVACLMRAADFFVYPSRYEACSLVLLEALACGLPVITAHTTGGSEIVTPDCGVVLSDPDDACGLALELQRLTAEPNRRAQMGKAARAVAEQYGWARMGDEYLEYYREIAASH